MSEVGEDDVDVGSVAGLKRCRPLRRRGAVLAGAVALSVATAGCGAGGGGGDSSGGGGSGGPIKVVVIADLTGPTAPDQLPSVAGVTAAVGEINAKGGVNGRKINIVDTLDAQSTAQGGGAAAQQAVGASPDFIIVNTSGVASAAALPTLKQANVPVLGITSFPVSQLEPAQPFLYGFGTSGTRGAAAYLGEAARVAGSQPAKIAIVALSDPTVDPNVNNIKSHAAAYGATVVDVERTPSTGVTSFTTQAAKIVASGANVVAHIDAVTSVVNEAKALVTAGFQGHMLAPYPSATDPTFKAINSPNYEAYRLGKLATPGDALYQAGTDANQSADKITGGTYSLGYAQGYVIKTAFAGCSDSCSLDQVQKALEAGPITVPNDALFGPIVFTSESHSGMTAAEFFRWDSAKAASVPASGESISLELKK
jgi:ABC-type branched-subunit amino acid transport system substrate-binding protein